MQISQSIVGDLKLSQSHVAPTQHLENQACVSVDVSDDGTWLMAIPSTALLGDWGVHWISICFEREIPEVHGRQEW